jgi:hypothetical protein
VGRRLPAYTCPTDAFNTPANNYFNATVPGDANVNGGWARGNYGISAGYEDYDHQAWGNPYKSSKKGYISTVNNMVSAPLASANFGCKLRDISDGPSNQFMFLELRAGMEPNDPRGVWAMGMPGASISNAGRGPYNPSPNNLLGGSSADGGDELEVNNQSEDGYVNPNTQPDFCSPQYAALGMGCTTSGNLMTSAMSRSMHVGGVNVALADGSGRFVSNNIDQLTYIRLSSTQDGQIVGDY